MLHFTLKNAHSNSLVINYYLSTIVDVRTQDLEGDLPHLFYRCIPVIYMMIQQVYKEFVLKGIFETVHST